MKIIGFMQVYNEVEKGNLNRCLDSLSKYCDDIVIYDDASTDNSVEVARTYTEHVIEGKSNDFAGEAEHRQELLELALKLNPDWIFWIDADEVLEEKGERGGLRYICENAGTYDSFSFQEVNLWRCPNFYRIDSQYNEGRFCRLWKNNGNLKMPSGRGLHKRLVPESLSSEGDANLKVLHYGFASDDSIINKYVTYRSHGQRGWALQRLIDERTLTVAKSNPKWFNYELQPADKNDIYRTPIALKVPQ
jgi:glycosyltransferase involved in cell wall biosynthesis